MAIVGMDNYEIATKLIYVGAYGAFVMQGHKHGIYVKIQIKYVYYRIPIYRMVHRMNIYCKIVINFNNVTKVDELVHDIHSYFFNSSKRVL